MAKEEFFLIISIIGEALSPIKCQVEFQVLSSQVISEGGIPLEDSSGLLYTVV
jgi:hypothetical protein